MLILGSASGTQILSNVISGSTVSDGIEVNGAGSGTVIRGNIIGLGANGSTSLGNRNTSIYVVNTNGVTIGGPSLSDRNIVSAAQLFFGVHLISSSNALVQNNYIGTDQAGALARPNRGESGLLIEGGSSGVQVLGNLISGNTVVA